MRKIWILFYYFYLSRNENYIQYLYNVYLMYTQSLTIIMIFDINFDDGCLKCLTCITVLFKNVNVEKLFYLKINFYMIDC